VGVLIGGLMVGGCIDRWAHGGWVYWSVGLWWVFALVWWVYGLSQWQWGQSRHCSTWEHVRPPHVRTQINRRERRRCLSSLRGNSAVVCGIRPSVRQMCRNHARTDEITSLESITGSSALTLFDTCRFWAGQLISALVWRKPPDLVLVYWHNSKKYCTE